MAYVPINRVIVQVDFYFFDQRTLPSMVDYFRFALTLIAEKQLGA